MSVLIDIDMPENCGSCQLRMEYDDESFCPFLPEPINYWIATGKRSENCQLKDVEVKPCCLICINSWFDEEDNLYCRYKQDKVVKRDDVCWMCNIDYESDCKDGMPIVEEFNMDEVKPIDYQTCADAMLKMWMDNVLTDGEYNRINSGLLSGFSTKKKTIVYVSNSSKTVGGVERMSQSGTKVFYADGCGIFEGASPRGYSSVSIPFSTTQYGGTIDVLRGKAYADMTRIRVAATLGDGWQLESGKPHSFFVYSGAIPGYFAGNTVENDSRFVCDTFKTQTPATVYAGTTNCIGKESARLRLAVTSCSTVSDLQTFLTNNEVYLCYKLATPIEIDLTPAELSLLAGYNYVYSDSNGNITMEYGEAIDSLNAKIDRLMARVAALEAG